MYKGTVKWFDEREGKNFGFVVCESFDDGKAASLEEGKEFFFHHGDGEPLLVRDDRVSFGTSWAERKSHLIDKPHKGDTIVFLIARGLKGEKASPWAYFSDYEKLAEGIRRQREAIANSPVYRVRKSSGMWGKANTPENPGDAEVLWEGQDLRDVMKKFPLPTSGSPANDPLLPYYSHDDGFEVRRWWEKQDKEGNWQHCPDPRDLPGVLRQFDRITNRY